MANQPKKKIQGDRSSRPNGKASKRNPGEPARRNNGKTQDGYSPAKLAVRAAARRTVSR